MTTVDMLDSITSEAGFPAMAHRQGQAAGTVDPLANLTPEQWTATREPLDTTGSVVYRGFGVRTVDDFERVAQGLLGELSPYRGGDSPRQAEKGFVHNAAGPSPSRRLRAHNELSYAPWHPTTLCFACGRPADEGGATTIIDGHRVYQSLPAEIRDAFRTKGVTHIQHYGAFFGDGTEIPADCIDVVSQTLIDCTVPVNWEAGDVLPVDNRAVTHGRLSFPGRRELFVAFA